MESGSGADPFRLVAYETDGPPPPRTTGTSGLVDLGVTPGAVRLLVSRWPAEFSGTTLHQTDTVDVESVLEGSVTVHLGDGPHLLEAGDVLVMNGVDHGWEAGPDGVTLSILILGTEPPA